jgi:CheY-like chemotaxis protein
MQEESNAITILLVEDERLLISAITQKLESYGVSVISCNSGENALGKIKNLDKTVDGIWLDYHLGDMDGIEFMSKMHEYEKWRDVPVFLVSNSATPETMNNMIKLGAKKYYVKAEQRLDSLVEEILADIKK